jgi:heme/copper-type cytochrome/quinol oxidase subunit 2
MAMPSAATQLMHFLCMIFFILISLGVVIALNLILIRFYMKSSTRSINLLQEMLWMWVPLIMFALMAYPAVRLFFSGINS